MYFRTTVRSLLLLATFASPVWANDMVRWAPSIEVAKQAAAAKNQLVLIHFEGDNCPPCMRLEANVFNQAKFAQSLERDYVPVKINGSQNPEIAREYQVDRWPQDVIISPSGQLVYRMLSPQDIDRYTGMLGQVASRNSEQAGQLAQAGGAAAGGMSGQVAQAGNNQPTSRFSRFGASDAAPQADPSPQADSAASSNSRFATSQPSGPAPQSQFAPSAPADSRIAQQPGSSNPNPGQRQPSEMVAGGAAAAGTVAGNQAQPGARSPGRSAAPPQEPQFALDGYCPVTLIEKMAWQKGDRRFGAVHLGKVYLFGSEANQKKFLADPNQFSPVFSGLDPVVFVTEGR
ncbi:MAG: thioredoxin family protein, partial [Pirellulaceae bacterium]